MLLALYTAEKITSLAKPTSSLTSAPWYLGTSLLVLTAHLVHSSRNEQMNSETNPNQPSRTFSRDYSAVCGRMGELCTCRYGWVLWVHIGISDLGLLAPPGDSLFFLVPTALSLVYWLIWPHKNRFNTQPMVGSQFQYKQEKPDWPSC